MSTRATFVFAALFLASASAFSVGVSPYLPMGTNPDMDAKIERMLMLADKPVLTRPCSDEDSGAHPRRFPGRESMLSVARREP